MRSNIREAPSCHATIRQVSTTRARSRRQLHARPLLGSEQPKLCDVDDDLRSPQRRLIELRIEHADLDSLIDLHDARSGLDDLTLRRLKKRRLALRDQIERLERLIEPPEPA